MLQNAYFLAKIGADTAENERDFAEMCQNFATAAPGGLLERRAAAAEVGHADVPNLGALLDSMLHDPCEDPESVKT